MPTFEELHDLVDQNLTKQSQSDRISASEHREVEHAILNKMEEIETAGKYVWQTASTYTLTAGKKLLGFAFHPTSDATIRIGTSAGADDIMADTDITSADGMIVDIVRYSKTLNKTFYFTGMPSSSQVGIKTETIA